MTAAHSYQFVQLLTIGPADMLSAKPREIPARLDILSLTPLSPRVDFCKHLGRKASIDTHEEDDAQQRFEQLLLLQSLCCIMLQSSLTTVNQSACFSQNVIYVQY